MNKIHDDLPPLQLHRYFQQCTEQVRVTFTNCFASWKLLHLQVACMLPALGIQASLTASMRGFVFIHAYLASCS